MRMMTGAILILASAVLIFLCGFGDLENMKVPRWMQYYAYATGIIGWAFMLWGLFKDLSAASWKRRRHKGDT